MRKLPRIPAPFSWRVLKLPFFRPERPAYPLPGLTGPVSGTKGVSLDEAAHQNLCADPLGLFPMGGHPVPSTPAEDMPGLRP